MLEGKYNAAEVEKKWQDYWQENKIYNFDETSDKKVFSIDTPPPTVNGKIHIGHIFSYSQTEMIARYYRMKGYNVFYPFGFDDNGLPTERLVEKQNDIKAHDVSREEFNKMCLKSTSELEKQFRELFISNGFGVDWNHEYSTINEKSRKTSQKSFIDLFKQKKVYYSEAPALWCHDCTTAIAQAELETKELKSIFNYLKFYLKDSDKYIEIATTRPELLPACCCIFVNPNDDRYKDLIGKDVKVPLHDFCVKVIADEDVDIEKGTGIVMCCTFGDLQDLEWYKKYNLPFKMAIGQNGRMTALCGKYEGLTIKKARNAIIEDLKENGYMIKQEDIVHNVAVHERCGTPVEITVKKQWFIDILSHKDEFLKAADKINWYPKNMKSRYTNWVENLQWDWGISRQRYFGVPFPVWYCKNCGEIIVADESKLPVNPLKDAPTCAKCEKCGCTDFTPETDIMDTWATSSMTPFINTNWIDDKEFSQKLMPMSLRPNAHDIIRTWDFYTIVKSIYHTGDIPWKNIMISGFVMASKNEKISKRKENSKIEPNTLINTYSSDVVRYWTATASLGCDVVFAEEEFKNGKKLVNKLWNASKFILMHLNDYNKNSTPSLLPMDEWIIAKFNVMYKKFDDYLSKYEIGLAFNELEKFFWNFCDNYIEIVKNRLYKPEIYGDDARLSGQKACYEVMFNMLKCFSIYFPHITEEVYQNYFKNYENEISIHKLTLSPIDESLFNNSIIELGDEVLSVITSLRKYKSENNLSLKAEIEKVIVSSNNIDFIKTSDMDIKATCSCKEIEYKKSNEFEVEVINIL